ncbi:MAG: glycosyl hydrolase [Flavobacteriaceae bacterium]|nr:glycosyl hydrolase [Flavobacteriaceae bacterium]
MKFINPFLVIFLLFSPLIQSQKKKKSSKKSVELNETYNNLNWRNIGPFRGGRSVTSEGVVKDQSTFYMGSTGGGIWKTEDNGMHWKNISDGFLNTGTVGAISVSESDPNVVIVGMGEHAARGVMTSMGDGVYKSENAGATWEHIGLENSRHIANVEIHPSNPDLIYVAVQGAQYGPSSDRGIYRSKNGGNTWEKVLYVSNITGASSLSMDKNNPRILYAAMWQHERLPWQMKSGGEKSGLYKSTDGGDSWTRLKKGLPEVIGKAGISVSRANSNLVYANIEAEGIAAGVYRSENGGTSWRQVNKDRVTVARSWYYMEVFADPQDENIVYVLNAPVLKSIDKGVTFKPMSTPHGDNHHLWIHPEDNKIMINSNDGGANVSTNGGKSWSTQQNQPTSQFYRVIADAQIPYHVYGGQQDNSAIGIKSRDQDRGIDWKDWYSVSGCESAFLAFDPKNPKVVYGGCYQGIIQRWNRETKSSKDIKEYPELALGNAPNSFKYRYNWNAPIISAPSDPNIIYHAGNVVFKTKNGGTDWEVISPDLTRNNINQQVPGGIPFTNEAAGGENYNTLMSLVASPHNPDVLWAGSDDGLIHITRDGGETWINSTPKGLKEGIINSIEVSPHNPETAYAVVMRYKFMDLNPYIYKTEDYGENWDLITDGIEGEHNFVRVVREDPKVPGLLYAGTETGFYISLNDGEYWEPFQNNLPIVPINDLYIQDNDLIAATAGRSFWILDDLSAIQQRPKDISVHLVTPKKSYRLSSGKTPKNSTQGTNPMSGVYLDYYLAEVHDSLEVKIDILQGDQIIRSYTSQKDSLFKSWPGGPSTKTMLKNKKGFNRTHWDFRREQLPSVDKVFVYGSYEGSLVAPGMYSAKLTYGEEVKKVDIEILPNPNMDYSAADFEAQQNLLVKIEKAIKKIHYSVSEMRDVQDQLDHYLKILNGKEEYNVIYDQALAIKKRLNEWETKLIQPNQKTFQDVINFNNMLNAQFMHLKAFIDADDPELTQGAKQRYKDLIVIWSKYKTELDQIIDNDFKAFEKNYLEAQVPLIMVNLNSK